MLKQIKGSISNALFQGKKKQFAFLLGMGIGYLQYRFFGDLLTSRAQQYDRSTQIISNLLLGV